MRRVDEYIRAGKIVACNFDLVGSWYRTMARKNQGRLAVYFGRKDPDVHRQRYAVELEMRSRAYRFDVPDDLYGFDLPGDPDEENRGLLVLDEGALRLNARNSVDRLKRAEKEHGHKLKELEFYVNMRKLGWTCLILAHSPKMLDSQVQDLGGAEVRLRNFARVRMPLVGIPMAKNPRFLAIHYWPEVRSITGREFYGLDKTIARHYRSMQRFSAAESELTNGLRLQCAPALIAQPVETYDEWYERITDPGRVPIWKQSRLSDATRRRSTARSDAIPEHDADARSGARTEKECDGELRSSRAHADEDVPPWAMGF
jgi:hypothetical protein